MVYVPAGEFLMGSAENDADAVDREKPQHTVYLDAFWIDRTEVTVAQFRNFVQATGYETTAERQGWGWTWVESAKKWQPVKGADWQHPFGPGTSTEDNYPVVQVSWYDATAYCTWVGGTLPTEAQWEKAARGTDGRIYPWGNTFDGQKLNYCDVNCPFDYKDTRFNDGYKYTAPVGNYRGGGSPYGALDMAGNVWEWVADWYGPYPSGRQENPAGPDSGDYRVLRGGSESIGWGLVRCAYRYWYDPAVPDWNIGFRCVVSAR